MKRATMFGHLTYIYWLLLFIVLPLALLAICQWRILWAQRRALGLALLGAAVGGWAWDALAVQLGAWYYQEGNITGIWIGGLPLEEWLWIAGVTLLFGAVTVVLMEYYPSRARFCIEPQRHKGTEEANRNMSLCIPMIYGLFGPTVTSTLSASTHFSHLGMLLVAGIIFHAMLWLRNAPFLWSQRGIILATVSIALVWMFVTDPIGGAWGAWFFNPDRIIGIWLFTYMPIEDLFGIAVVSSAAACAVLVFGYGSRRWI